MHMWGSENLGSFQKEMFSGVSIFLVFAFEVPTVLCLLLCGHVCTGEDDMTLRRTRRLRTPRLALKVRGGALFLKWALHCYQSMLRRPERHV